jgi:hypothetical protein
MAVEKKKNDFDAETITQATEQHGKDITGITDRLTTLENKLKPDQIAIALESASDDSKKLNKLFAKLFCEMVKDDKDVKSAVGNMINEADRGAVRSFWKKFGFATWSAIIFIVGVLFTAIISHFIR